MKALRAPCRHARVPRSLLAVFALTVFLLFPRVVLAHQPRIVESGPVGIHQPEVSQAFYGELTGTPVEYRIQSAEAFRLYVGILVPDIPGVRKDISAEIYRITPNGNEPLAILGGRAFEWTPFFEEFARDHYFWGPQFAAEGSHRGVGLKGRTVPGGTYVIKVFSPTNEGKYTLVTGDLEEFPLREIINAATTIPQIKARFFEESPLRIILSPFGWGYVLVLYALAFIAGLVYRTLLRKLAKTGLRTKAKNIGGMDRLVRAGLGLALLIWAVATSWNPILLFFSGFCIFEAIFSWCGFYAAIGKSSCPLNCKGRSKTAAGGGAE